MANVFANGMEVAAKKSGNKVIAAMPDVCLSPPSPPAGPIPIPYPNFSKSSDTNNGSKSVKIAKKPINLKNKSDFKKSKGDEAATKSLGMGMVIHGLGGPVKHGAWSCDVKIEGKNACRFGDMVTGNHGSPMANSATTGLNLGKGKPGVIKIPDCEALQREVGKMRRASDRADSEKLKEASDLSQTAKSKYARKLWGKIKKKIEDRCWTRSRGALTASQTSGGPMRRWASNTLNREAMRAQGMKVEDQARIEDNSSKVCNGDEPYPPSEREHPKTHTESQALEALPWGNKAAMPASITFATSWLGRGDPALKDRPCPGCREKIEEACDCGLKVYVCVGDKPEDQCVK